MCLTRSCGSSGCGVGSGSVVCLSRGSGLLLVKLDAAVVGGGMERAP